MFFILSKLLTFLINPLVWIVTLVGLALFLKKEKWKKRSLQLCFACILFFSNNWINSLVLTAWETPPMLVSEIEAPFDLAIVLGGYSKLGNDLPNDQQLFPFANGGNRLNHAVELYKLGKVKKLLLSGGSGKVFGEKVSESTEAKSYLLSIGIPASDIIVEPTSRNTRENALFTANLLKELHLSRQSILLISSANHLPRAHKCFTAVGLSVTPFAVDVTPKPIAFQLENIIPQIDALNNWKGLIKEWVGYFVYWMRGWV